MHPQKINTLGSYKIRKISLCNNFDYIQTHCNDRRNPFHFACPQWFSYNNPQCNMV